MWVSFVNKMSLLPWLATHKSKSCALPTQSAHDDNLEDTGSRHLQIDNPAAGSVEDIGLFHRLIMFNQLVKRNLHLH